MGAGPAPPLSGGGRPATARGSAPAREASDRPGGLSNFLCVSPRPVGPRASRAALGASRASGEENRGPGRRPREGEAKRRDFCGGIGEGASTPQAGLMEGRLLGCQPAAWASFYEHRQGHFGSRSRPEAVGGSSFWELLRPVRVSAKQAGAGN